MRQNLDEPSPVSSEMATKMNEKAEIVATMAENVWFISRSGNENE